MPEPHPIVYPVEMRGFNSLNPSATVYPDSPDLLNVRKTRAGAIAKRDGFTTYNATAMPATTRAITGIAQFNRRDTTTRYTIVGTQEKLFVAPTSGAWTTLASTLGASATDYWDFAVFNNEIICVNGVSTPQISDGTAGGTGSLSAGVWQTRSRSPDFQAYPATALGNDGSYLYNVGGTDNNALSIVIYHNQRYDTYGDAWKLMTPAPVLRNAGICMNLAGQIVMAGGAVAVAGTANATVYRYNPVSDSWQSGTSLPASRTVGASWSMGDRGYAATGNTDGTSPTGQATVFQYDIRSDSWTTKTALATARSFDGGFTIGNIGYAVSGYDTGGVGLTTVGAYNGVTDTVSAPTSIATATRDPAGCPSAGNGGIGYLGGGRDAATPGTYLTTFQYYTQSTNAWTASTALTAATAEFNMGLMGYWLYMHGGNNASSVFNDTYRWNITPAAPTAYYVDTVKGYVILARTSSFPSRVFYCVAGDGRQWPAFNFFDVNPDDGDWITGLFVYRNELYVSKTDKIFRIPFSRLDPVKGDQEVIPVPDVPGTVSNRSIVVTDQGVFYLAEDGFRVFDGAHSHNISNKIMPTLNGYVQSRNKYCAGVWNTATDEIWWSLTSTGSTHDRIVIYNMKWQEWYIWSGIAAESLSIVEDANDIDQILFGTGNASDGRLFLAASTNADNGAAINAYYQSGWFYPAGMLTEFCPRELFMLLTRDGNWSLTVQTRRLFGSTNQTNDTDVNLLSGTYPDRYFQDASEQRARIALGVDNNGYAQSIRFANANASQTFTVVMAIMTGHPGIGGYPVV